MGVVNVSSLAAESRAQQQQSRSSSMVEAPPNLNPTALQGNAHCKQLRVV